ncbi:MAG: DUF4215 domain-containing protein [Labilithrix sp.]|nr:DUF4215 domain-containing protein [Labilithrix sp.]
MRLRSLFFSAAAVASVLIATQGCALLESTDSTKEDRLCVPGAYVFCRCADRTPGTKLCRDDAKSFDACMTSDDGECVGGEIDDPQTNEPIPDDRDPDPDDEEPGKAGVLDSCPGKSTAVQPGQDIKLEGDTSTATDDRKGRQGACAVGAGASDHVYRLIPSGSGSLDVRVQGSDGLDPVAYVRTTCDDEASQVSCGPPSANKSAQLKLNVTTGREYFLIIDGASASAGKYVADLKLTTGSFCGDGKVDANEACDDGNKVEDDGCSNNCRSVNGNPTSGGSCAEGGHPVEVWSGQTVTGTGSTNGYGNAWNAPSQACDPAGSNSYQDHIYAVTPRATGNLVVTLSAQSGVPLPNLMLSARRTCTSATPATSNMCANNGSAGAGETMTFPVTKDTKVWVGVDGGGITNNKGDYAISFRLQ